MARQAEEGLEDRTALATLTWNPAPGSTDFNTATNWTPDAGVAHAPTINDIIVYNNTSTANCTLPSDEVVQAVRVLPGYTGTINLNSHTLKVDDPSGSTPSGLGAGTIGGGTLQVFRGTFSFSGGAFQARPCTWGCATRQRLPCWTTAAGGGGSSTGALHLAPFG